MLQPAWYLTNHDWFAQLADAPHLNAVSQAVLGQVAELFSDESYFNPAKTVATVHVMLLAAEHLGDTLAWATNQHDLADLTRLTAGLNLVQAHLTQIMQRLAEQTHNRALRDSDTVPVAATKELVDSLSAAGNSTEVCAGHLKEANLTLHGLTK